MSDVVTTLEEEDLNGLEEYELTEDLEEMCAISMNNLVTGTKVIKLPCNHIFESEAIKEYLRNYNYKCPVCRSECGRGHHNI